MKLYKLCFVSSLLMASLLVLGSLQLSSAQKSSTTNDSSASDITVFSDTTNQTNEIVNGNPTSIPSAQSVYETGTMSLPTSVKSFIIFIPDEAHHVPEDQKTISPKNPNYLPSTLQIPDGIEVAFVHGDPQHVHVEIVKDNGGNLVWTTTPVKHPGGSDTKLLNSDGSPYAVSDKQYTIMQGKIVVNPEKSTGTLTVGGFFCPTKDLDNCKSEFTNAGFQILSEHNFVTKSVQKDISGDNTLLIYSTPVPLKDAIDKLKPIIDSLPYK